MHAADDEEDDNMRPISRTAMLIPILALAAACATAKTHAGGPAPSASSPSASPASLPTFGPGASYHPVIVAANFTADVTNPWFPLKPGSRWIYSGTKDSKKAKDVVTIPAATTTIAGVPVRPVKDALYLNGKLEERTTDYYTQDLQGNVWYFGEDTAELDAHGKVLDTEGSWKTGVAGAEPGVFMQSDPQRGVLFRQEYYAGHAEDQYSAIDLSAKITVPFGSYTDALRTEETTRLEPTIVDNKYYAKGVGEVMEVQVKGPPPIEKLVLVSFTSG